MFITIYQVTNFIVLIFNKLSFPFLLPFFESPTETSIILAPQSLFRFRNTQQKVEPNTKPNQLNVYASLPAYINGCLLFLKE